MVVEYKAIIVPDKPSKIQKKKNIQSSILVELVIYCIYNELYQKRSNFRKNISHITVITYIPQYVMSFCACHNQVYIYEKLIAFYLLQLGDI